MSTKTPTVSGAAVYAPDLPAGSIRLDTAAWFTWLETPTTTSFSYPVFDPTCGYKGLVPVARDVASLIAAHGASQTPPVTVRMGYLFQTSSELIWHDPLPFTFTWDKLPLDALRQAGEPGGLAAQDLPPSWAGLFEPGDLPVAEAAPRKRSAAGEVVYALALHLSVRSPD